MEAWNYEDDLDNLAYQPKPNVSIDIWQVEGEDDVTVEEGTVDSDNLVEWLDRNSHHQESTPISWRFRMLIEDGGNNRPKVYWSRTDFEIIMNRWNLSKQLPGMINQGHNIFTALSTIKNKRLKNEHIGYTFTTTTKMIPFWTCGISYCPFSRTTTAILSQQTLDEDSDYLLARIKDYLVACQTKLSHPLLLPIYIMTMRIPSIVHRVTYYYEELKKIEYQTGHNIHNVPGYDSDPLQMDFVTIVQSLNNVGIRVQNRRGDLRSQLVQLEEVSFALSRLETFDGSSGQPNLQEMSESLELHLRHLAATVQTSISDLDMISSRVQIQLQVVYNYVAQRDNKLNLEMARDSRAVALESKRDSSSMKTIAILTMIFLPATTISSILGMPYFSVPQETPTSKLRVHPQFWMYWAITLPLTIAVIWVWFVWIWLKTRRHNREDVEAGVDFERGTGNVKIWKKAFSWSKLIKEVKESKEPKEEKDD